MPSLKRVGIGGLGAGGYGALLFFVLQANDAMKATQARVAGMETSLALATAKLASQEVACSSYAGLSVDMATTRESLAELAGQVHELREQTRALTLCVHNPRKCRL
jgi:outer membrane protein TolC